MRKRELYHLYYSGMDRYDFDQDWLNRNAEIFCGSCRRLKIFDREIDVRLDRKISGKPDMLFAGYLPVPGIASDRLIGLLGSEGRRFLNVGRVISVEGGVEFGQPYKSFSGKYGYVTLRGKKPSIFKGVPFPENERLVVCNECGFESRRERAPWFLLESECPDAPISCTGLGILIDEDIYKEVEGVKLKDVLVQSVEIL
ncbi:hypothetical protein [Burkholderia stagnalis]|uniref:hypothetical protein n=1 Tax=Burkholderia stagnalis TaxID=1503054 RepID=UPI000F56C4F6|nr:hypothetical protein [Burkholderia stagnalis]